MCGSGGKESACTAAGDLGFDPCGREGMITPLQDIFMSGATHGQEMPWQATDLWGSQKVDMRSMSD